VHQSHVGNGEASGATTTRHLLDSIAGRVPLVVAADRASLVMFAVDESVRSSPVDPSTCLSQRGACVARGPTPRRGSQPTWR